MNTPNSALQELTLLWLKKLVCSLNSGIEQNRIAHFRPLLLLLPQVIPLKNKVTIYVPALAEMEECNSRIKLH